MKGVSKQIFVKAVVCPTLGWQLRCGELAGGLVWAKLTPGEKFRIEQGLEIGRRARELYPEGSLVKDVNLVSSARKTEALMADPGVPVIFEGTFIIDGYVTRADVLKRKGDGWHMSEVKSAANDREQFIDDMAYTAMVIDRCGFNISGVSLLLVSRDFRLGMANEALFAEVDHTEEVLARVDEFKTIWQQIEEITRASEKPEPQLVYECRRCELFGECVGRDIANHIFDVPRLSQSKFDELAESGIVCIEAIPDGFPLTENQVRVRDCVLTGSPFVGGGLGSELSSISWPAYYLDFEAVMTAIPLYPDIAPYTQIPTQYSIHKCSGVGVVIDHRDYLADPARDCRRELAENLIDDLGEDGSIIAYSTYEKTVISSLGKLYPDLTEKLDSLAGRLIDLEAIIRKNYYHPDFHGSTSIKKTAPVLVPDLSYDGLEIGDGDSAMVVFAYMAQGKYKDLEKIRSIRRNLLEYCKQDTMAMVRLHQSLVECV
ncbi:DUF2779 domain-containing protein [Chloroflexota bacterium]